MATIVTSPDGFCPIDGAGWGVCEHAYIEGYFGEFVLLDELPSRVVVLGASCPECGHSVEAKNLHGNCQIVPVCEIRA
jgi:hypothetical protein